MEKQKKQKKQKTQKPRFQFGFLLLAIVLAAVGVVFMMFSSAPSNLSLALGILVILFSSYFFVKALSDRNRGALFVVRLIVAFSVLLGGVATVVFHNAVADLLLSLFALALIIDGSFKLQLTASLKAYTRPLFWVMLVLATGVIVGAFIALRFPFEETESNAVFVGLMLILDAVANLFHPFGAASCVKAKMKAEGAAAAAPATEQEQTPAEPMEEASSEPSEETEEKKA